MSLLTIIRDACLELSLDTPNSVVSSNDKQHLQLLAFANRTGRELVKYKTKGIGWTVLQKEFRFEVEFTTKSVTLVQGSNVINFDTTGIDKSYKVYGEGLNGYCSIVSLTTTSATLLPTEKASTSGVFTLTFSKSEYDLPSDYDSLISDSYYPYLNTNGFWRSVKLDAREVQDIRVSGTQYPYYYNKFAIKGKKVIIEPNPTTQQVYSLLYLSKNWISNIDDTMYYSEFNNDTDISLFDEDLIVLGVIWRFKSANGYPYDEDYQIYMQRLETLAGEDGGSESLIDLGGREFYPFISYRNIPEGNYGLD